MDRKSLEREIASGYNNASRAHEEVLRGFHVRLPSLHRGGALTKDGIVLGYLAYRMGEAVTKTRLTAVVSAFYPETTDVQQARHLSRQKGWNILSRRRGDVGTEDWPPDSYGLVSLECPFAGFRPESRSAELDDAEWEALQDRFDHRCATCGSQEGHPNLRNRAAVTRLQKGHRDPSKSLSPQNCIPQCEECNRPALGKWVWDRNGHPYAIADPEMILKSSVEVQRQVFRLLQGRTDID